MKTKYYFTYSIAVILLFAYNITKATELDSPPKKELNNSFKQKNYLHSFSNSAPVLTAIGNQIYCPLTNTNIATNITITDIDDSSTDAIYIQISSGYSNAEDKLTLNNNILHPTIKSSWNANEGKLTLSSSTPGLQVSYTDFIYAIKDVQFSNSSTSPTGIRNFSISIGQANYLPRNGHYYEYVPSLGITWTNAKAAADIRTYYGLKGYLATITAADEAQLAGKQAPGAGWIGGSDAETEGVWKWATGPEAGTIFWNGLSNGSTPNFAFWNSGEPNQFGGAEEDYAHITAPGVGINGSWNDLTNTGDPSGNYQPKGYIVEYGGTIGDPALQLSASTTLTMSQITVTNPSPICSSESTTLQATSTTATISWYDTATNGTLLQTGNSYSTAPLFSNTTFFIDNGCIARTPISVTVNPLPNANTVVIPRQCDNNHDGILTFNTASLETTLINGQTNVTAAYFDQFNNPLKDSNGILISSPFPASFTTTSQTIKAVVTTTNPLHCFAKTNIDFVVDDLPEAFAIPITTTTTCDDEPNPINQDGKFAFNTSTYEAIILGGQTGMTVKYFDKNGIQLASPLPNPFVTDTQDIKVTVENSANTTCSSTTTLNFVVNPLPIVNDITIVQCDTDLVSNGKTLFNLTVNNDMISTNYSNETFTYYTTLNGARNKIPTDLISNALAFENTTPTAMDVWVNVSNKITNCSSVAKITLKVPATNITPTYKIPFPPVCDDLLDINGNNTANNNNRDGIATFNFSATKAIVAGLLPPTDAYNINYYRNKSDALAENNVITDISNYRNIGYPNSQDIWVRIDSDLDNACYGLGPYLTLNVEPLPLANLVTIPRQCDDDQDGIFTFNTSSLESTLLQGQTNVLVTYFDQNNNPLKDANGVLINSPFPPVFKTTSQTIKAIITNNTPQQCIDQTTITFIVDDSPKAFTVPSTVTTACDDELNPMDQDGKFAFDTSTIQSTILGGQKGMIVKYFDPNGVDLPSPLPNPFATTTQNITATVQNPLNTGCVSATTLNFVVNPVPNIDLNLDGKSSKLICSNMPTIFETLDAGILDGSPTAYYNYIWTKDGVKLSNNTPTLDVNAEGIYTVEVINSSNCSRIRTITVAASNSATITSIDIVELTDVNTMTVNTVGPGDYQYTLDDLNGYWQDSNFFDNAPAGIHEVFVRDKNGCGTVSQKIAIVGVPKFFTPNNDGYNDVWEIIAITKYPLAEITVFDRYGKLITKLNSSNNSWDGTFNKNPLPATDYWYVLKLDKDSPEVKGHFSLKR